jgi:4-amino-4-deoxy-L-arabinose transferase-like glycosyltransferase
MLIRRPDIFITSEPEIKVVPKLPDQVTQPAISVLDVPDLPTIRQPSVRLPKQQRNVFSIMQEWGIVGLLLLIAILVRVFAAFHAGLEVDEPIYRNAAALALQYGFPTIRPAYLHPVTPFLYHPPFFLYFLAGWFELWGSTSYITGRMSSVVVSIVMLLLLYMCTKQMMGRKVALVALLLVGGDPWIIFTNQAIYLENSLMVLVILAIWVYWRATLTAPSSRIRYLGWYALAGLLVGSVVIYKQVGGFIILSVFLSLLLQRKHWLGHTILFTMALLVVVSYGLAMHHAFGALYDAATWDQLLRTLGRKKAPGLNDSIIAVLAAIWSLYWMFFITVLALFCGSGLTLIRYVQLLLRRRNVIHPVVLGWALGGLVFAMGISLKDPHYMILWIVPLYLVLSQEIVGIFWHKKIPFRSGRRGLSAYAPTLGLLLCIFILMGDAFGFQARFTNIPGDALQHADEYMNQTLPPSALVLTQNYIGVDLIPQFLDITQITTPKQILQKGITYMALYWSQTQPISPSLGPVDRYCLSLETFNGFKDHVEVCQIDRVALAGVVNPSRNPTKKAP